MGGSHGSTASSAPSYRRAGSTRPTHVASEYLRAPLPGAPALLVTSQSGRSGEILRLIDAGLAGPRAIGLTMEADSPLARALPSLVGAGGPERAYAATRSQLIALAQHAALLEALGADIGEIVAVLEAGPERPARPAGGRAPRQRPARGHGRRGA
jgi:fructoselysine-6-P-deglycase FrlB-like protein